MEKKETSEIISIASFSLSLLLLKCTVMIISRANFKILFIKYIQPHMQEVIKTGTFRNSKTSSKKRLSECRVEIICFYLQLYLFPVIS